MYSPITPEHDMIKVTIGRNDDQAIIKIEYLFF